MRTVLERSTTASLSVFKIGRLVHTNDFSARKTVAAQSWCSKLSRERFSALALSWHNRPARLVSGVGQESRPDMLNPSFSEPDPFREHRGPVLHLARAHCRWHVPAGQP